MKTPTLESRVAARIKIERRIISRLVKDALKAGYCVSVFDGEEFCLKRSTAYRAIMNSIMSTDEDMLRFRVATPRSGPAGELIGNVYLVYGNDGHDVIADYSDNAIIRLLVAGADRLADQIAMKQQ